MKYIEPIFLIGWLTTILVYQFHEQSNRFIKRFNLLGLVPNFHLFSPKPFLGVYIIRYQIFKPANIGQPLISKELKYISDRDFLDCNKRLIKCVNNLCKSPPAGKSLNNNYSLILNFIKSSIQGDYTGNKLQFKILFRNPSNEKLIYVSGYHDL